MDAIVQINHVGGTPEDRNAIEIEIENATETATETETETEITVLATKTAKWVEGQTKKAESIERRQTGEQPLAIWPRKSPC